MKTDALDMDILSSLREDGRATVRSLALEHERRRATIHSRIGKMEENNLIRGYTVIPDFQVLNFGITVFIMASIQQKEFSDIDELHIIHKKITMINNITEVYSTSGEYDFLLKARVSDLIDVQKIIYQLRTLSIRKTYTISVFETHTEELGNHPFNLGKFELED